MKRLVLLAVFSFATFALNAQEISEEQWSLVTKKTATWCPFCGQWGWDFKDFLLEDFADQNVVVWMAHHSGDLMTPTAKAITDNFGSSGQPVFYLNEDNMSVNASNLTAKRMEYNENIEILNGLVPFAGVGSSAVFDGEKITSTSKVKFVFELEGGEYWLASYLVDQEVIANQASQGNNAKHENILLHAFQDSHFGEMVSNGALIEANQEFIVEGELDFSGEQNIPDYSDGYSIVTILWSKVGDKYTPFNLNEQPIEKLVSTNDVLKSIDVAAFHLGNGQINLNIKSDQNITNAKVHLFDMNGRTIATKSSLQINQGANQIMLETQELNLGTYVVVVESELGSRSIKVSVR